MRDSSKEEYFNCFRRGKVDHEALEHDKSTPDFEKEMDNNEEERLYPNDSS